MGWSIGYDNDWQRDIGYGVPAYCDHPGCNEKIDRGLAYVCGGEPWGQPHGCGLYFCSKHLWYKRVESGEFVQACARCKANKEPFEASPDHPEWIAFKLNDDSWEKWRDENPDIERQMQATLDSIPKRVVAAAIKKARADVAIAAAAKQDLKTMNAPHLPPRTAPVEPGDAAGNVLFVPGIGYFDESGPVTPEQIAAIRQRLARAAPC